MSDLISDDVKAFEERYRSLVDWEVRRFPELKRDVDDDLRKLRELADRIRPLVCCCHSVWFLENYCYEYEYSTYRTVILGQRTSYYRRCTDIEEES